MLQIDEDFFQSIVDFLFGIQEPEDPKDRDQKWRTANELLVERPQLRSQFNDGAELDSALCARFLADGKTCPIRPAYYPGRTTLSRLWGHRIRVDDGPDNLDVMLKAHPYPHERLKIDENIDAPVVFLSHALADHHFAGRLRLALARESIRSWIAEGELNDGCKLFEAIDLSLRHCNAVLVLVSSFSLSSAWVDTEVHSAHERNKPVMAIVDASDTAIGEFLEGWKTVSKWLEKPEGIQALSNVLKRFLETAPKASRVLKFRDGVDSTLNSLTLAGRIAFYPDTPEELAHHGWIGQFADVLSEIKTGSKKAAT